MDLYTQFGIIAAREAIKDSGLDLEQTDKRRIGVIWGAGIGGLQTFLKSVIPFRKEMGRRGSTLSLYRR